MKLVTIILLLCVHSADSANREGKAGEVVFCDANDELKLDTSAGELVTWKFNGNDLPSGVTHPDTPTKKDLKIATLAAANTGFYKATYSSTVKKFTIIVDAKTCTAATPCDVKVGGSIKLDSGEPTGVTWHFKAPNSEEIEITDTEIEDAPKFTTSKKELGLFVRKKTQSGKYTAKKTGNAEFPKEFPVAVRAPVSKAQVKITTGKARVCPNVQVVFECTVTGDAKSYSWTKDAKPKASETTSKLTIQNATSEDSGPYVCKVTGFLGETATSPGVTLIVQAQPCAVSKEDSDNKRDNTGSAPPPTTSEGLPGRGPQGASISVALLLISVLVELYVMML